MTRRTLRLVCAALAGAAVMTAPAPAEWIAPGLYALGNHPKGEVSPPGYGLRLDELYNATGGKDRFSFDFDDPASNMQLVYDDSAATITISGVAFGGRDIGSKYAQDQYLGVYEVNFTYSLGVGPVPDDDDLWVTAPSGSNTGTIRTPLGDVFDLADKAAHGYTFRLGDENNDKGHRGVSGISGWGWVTVNGAYPHGGSSDFIFYATPVPEPASIALLAGAALLAAARRP